MKNWLIACMIVASAMAAQAEAPRLRMYGNVGHGFGGDALVKGTWSNGEPWDLRAGSGPVLAVGADFRIADRITIQGSVGHQRNSIDGTNGNVAFARVPVELLGFYAVTQQFRLGLGVRQSQSAKVVGGGVASGVYRTYDSSAGAVLEVQYLFSAPSASDRTPVVGVHLRLISEGYTQNNGGAGAEKISGNHVAAGLVFYY
jgi:hypothetical protein